MFDQFLRSLLGGLLFCASCTAGGYDVTPCNPMIAALNFDVCNTLNPDPSACMLYQCDAATANCKLSLRDFDRDGDPDAVCPGGTDCNDFDPAVNGKNNSCLCDQTQTQKQQPPCTDGIGVCQQTVTYMCKVGVLYCPAPPIPAPGVGYMDHADSTTKSWDWNCNGNLELGCRDAVTSQISGCPAANCNTMVQSAFIGGTSTSNDAGCTAFCTTLKPTDPQCNRDFENVVICDASCGKPVVTCHCGPNVINTACQRYTALTQPPDPKYVSMQSLILCK